MLLTHINQFKVKSRRIAIASDHAGYYLKEKIIGYLAKNSFEVRDMGNHSFEETDDYPDFGHQLALAVANGECELGISICGTGNGINMTVNKHQGIRSAICWNAEIAQLARRHNDANICALPARFINESEAFLIVREFLETGFDGGRHKRRIEKIPLKLF